ncbi:MAG TPA: C39 family peptidase [Candidatus Aminicenantes bacterium]|nr:C39 family peptidase [Candidatus Aminicenantes bacterium]HRY65718.1 C39 family peptidase [Candidatus Aminicenantes bacterium]HRZ72632.1 C39 family peptidase [Candidatus Aminicenantes bacterium]
MKRAFSLLVALAAGWLAGTCLPIPLAGLRDALAPAPAPVRSVPPAAPPAASSPAAGPAPGLLSAVPSGAAAPSPAAPVPADSPFAAVPDVRQSTGYSCGAAALQAVLACWGIEEREDRLAARLGTTPEQGTHPDAIVRGARELGLTAEMREGLELADLERALAEGASVIVDLQAWRDKPDAPWAETWDDGHYMVLLGLDAANLYFEDPSLLGARGVIPRAEFIDRWHDYEGEAPLDPSDRRYVHMAIFLRGEGRFRARPAAFEPVR